MNDKEFGQRVRQLRESASMTREQFCDDELELSVRQLTRIEAEVLPSRLFQRFSILQLV